jgi:hypothetical protein
LHFSVHTHFHPKSRFWHFECGCCFFFSNWYLYTFSISLSNFRRATSSPCTVRCMHIFTLLPDLGNLSTDVAFFSNWYLYTFSISPSNFHRAKSSPCTFLCIPIFILIPDIGNLSADVAFPFRIGIYIPFIVHVPIFVGPQALLALLCSCTFSPYFQILVIWVRMLLFLFELVFIYPL